jgi:hypothetical protein
MTDDLIQSVAKSIYNTHWRGPASHWDTASHDLKEWVRKQAISAIKAYDDYRSEHPEEFR